MRKALVLFSDKNEKRMRIEKMGMGPFWIRTSRDVKEERYGKKGKRDSILRWWLVLYETDDVVFFLQK